MQVKAIFKDTDELAIVVKGYPRLSETFIAQEILTLQNAGIKITIISLRHPEASPSDLQVIVMTSPS